MFIPINMFLGYSPARGKNSGLQPLEDGVQLQFCGNTEPCIHVWIHTSERGPAAVFQMIDL